MTKVAGTGEEQAEASGPQGERGCLVVVGTGIQWGGQTTLAAQRAIQAADRVLFAVADAGTVAWLRSQRPDAISLRYGDGPQSVRRRIYREMVEDILVELRQKKKVCAVFYGHPGVFSTPAHEAIRAAKAEGFPARMLAGVSFLDCLYADLGFDPGNVGCIVYEATDFLVHRRPYDVHTPLVVSQIAVIGNSQVFDSHAEERIRTGLRLLSRELRNVYPVTHEVIVYDASTHPIEPPRLARVKLGELASANVTEVSTLFVPPTGPAPVDEAMLAELSLAGSSHGADND